MDGAEAKQKAPTRCWRSCAPHFNLNSSRACRHRFTASTQTDGCSSGWMAPLVHGAAEYIAVKRETGEVRFLGPLGR